MIWNETHKGVRSDFASLGQKHQNYMFDCYKNREFPLLVWRELAQLGLFEALVKHDNETALPWLSAAYEGFAYGSNDLAFGIAPICHGAMAIPLINRHGSEAAKKKYLQKAMNGASIISFAVTESQSGGTDAYHSDCHLTSYQGQKLLNGKKWHITSAPYADLAMVWCTDDYHSLVAVLVETDSEGVTVGDKINCAGARTSPVGTFEFKNVVIPNENVIRFKNAKRTLTDILIMERVVGTFAGIGLIRLLIEKCVGFLKTRKVNGVKLGSHQYMQQRVTDMQSKLTQLEALSHSTLSLMARGVNVDLESSVLKPFAAEAVFTCAKEAGQICASYGLREEAQIYSSLLDSWSAMIGGGTEEAHRMIVWSKMRKLYGAGRPIATDTKTQEMWQESEEILQEVKDAV